MHNLISFNSLRPWMNLERETSSNDSVDDYFECISECDVRDKTYTRLLKENYELTKVSLCKLTRVDENNF